MHRFFWVNGCGGCDALGCSRSCRRPAGTTGGRTASQPDATMMLFARRRTGLCDCRGLDLRGAGRGRVGSGAPGVVRHRRRPAHPWRRMPWVPWTYAQPCSWSRWQRRCNGLRWERSPRPARCPPGFGARHAPAAGWALRQNLHGEEVAVRRRPRSGLLRAGGPLARLSLAMLVFSSAAQFVGVLHEDAAGQARGGASSRRVRDRCRHTTVGVAALCAWLMAYQRGYRSELDDRAAFLFCLGGVTATGMAVADLSQAESLASYTAA